VPRLDQDERERLLGVMGFDVWVRRGSEPLAQGTPAPATPTAAREELRVVPRSDVTRPRTQAASGSVEPASPAPAATRIAAQAVLLILEQRLHADRPFIKHLRLALPGCTICTSDTIPRGTARYAVQLGVDASLPVDLLGLRAPSIDELQRSASARRALWWSIKPVLRALRR